MKSVTMKSEMKYKWRDEKKKKIRRCNGPLENSKVLEDSKNVLSSKCIYNVK